MPYCTQADLEDAISKEKLIDLTDDDSLGSVVTARIVKAQQAADTFIDSYIRGKFTLPLVNPTADVLNRLRQISTDLTIFFLYQRRRSLEMPEDITKMYERNQTYLRDVAAGRVLLDTPAATPNTGNVMRTNKTSASREFTSDRLGTY